MMDENELADLLSKLKKAKNELVLGDYLAEAFDDVADSLTRYGQRINPCALTLSHTRHWCGHPLCRES